MFSTAHTHTDTGTHTDTHSPTPGPVLWINCIGLRGPLLHHSRDRGWAGEIEREIGRGGGCCQCFLDGLYYVRLSRWAKNDSMQPTLALHRWDSSRQPVSHLYVCSCVDISDYFELFHNGSLCLCCQTASRNERPSTFIWIDFLICCSCSTLQIRRSLVSLSFLSLFSLYLLSLCRCLTFLAPFPPSQDV